ncbi:hypothetical protein ABZ621_02535 [Streptomyces sp. NPDC007863]|uniref:hypothetical protein n=1 Tax=Streptomyces sp. NPDC007863 TaxID=3154894 RepID=UPI0033E13E09
MRIHYRLAGDDVAQLLALLRKVADHHQAAVPAARDAYLGEDTTAELDREELQARIATGDVVVHDVRAIRLNDGMLEWRLSELPVDAADPA